MTAHTPGPWICVFEASWGWCVKAATKYMAFSVKREEDARLMAAAPALLEALREADSLLQALCCVAMRGEVYDFLPQGLLVRVGTWIEDNKAEKAIRLAKEGK